MMSFRAALANYSSVACPEDCDCARGAVSRRQRHSAWCEQASLADYWSSVYPTADIPSHLHHVFPSLHYVYDHGCSILPFTCRAPGVMLRWLYGSMLPCTAWPSYMRTRTVQQPSRCLEDHAAFTPSWAAELSRASFVEVEHRAFGLGLPEDALPDAGRTLAGGASDFLDAGVAGMWCAS